MARQRAGAPRRPSLAQAIRMACENGLPIVRTEIHPDGRIILVHLETEPSAVSSTPFDEWKARRDARQS